MFEIKSPSVMSFDTAARFYGRTGQNVKKYFETEGLPCYFELGKELDEVDSDNLRKSFTRLFAEIQRAKYLDDFSYMDNHYLS